MSVSKRTVYRLLDIDQISDLSNFDTVIISTGVNDISRYRENGDSLFNKLRDKLDNIIRFCPNTTFVFRAVLSTRVSEINHEIGIFNINMFRYCRNFNNLWFFDTCGIPNFNFLDPQGNGVHIRADLARDLSDHLLRHGVYLAIRSQSKCTPNMPHPGIWPLRPFLRNL